MQDLKLARYMEHKHINNVAQWQSYKDTGFIFRSMSSRIQILATKDHQQVIMQDIQFPPFQVSVWQMNALQLWFKCSLDQDTRFQIVFQSTQDLKTVSLYLKSQGIPLRHSTDCLLDLPDQQFLDWVHEHSHHINQFIQKLPK